MRLYIDIETRWSVDLKQHGTSRCAADPHAGINCLAYAVDDGPIQLLDFWGCASTPRCGEFYDAWCSADQIVAHNALFERDVLKRVWNLDSDRWLDTMAKAAYYGYPRSLDEAAKTLGCSVLKDVQAHSVMLKLVQPIYTPEDCPDDFARLYEYCKTDVEVMRQIDKKLPDLPPDVQENWALDAEINLLGVPIDLKMVRNAVALRKQCAEEANAEMQRLTSGTVGAVTEVAKIQAWFAKRNIHLVDVTADTVERTLQRADLLAAERRVLELRQESGLSSLAKYEKMLDFQVDGRLHHMFDWYGTHPGRPTGRGPQVVNLPRAEDPEFWADTIANCPSFIIQVATKPLEKIKEALRGSICAEPGKHLVWMDLAQFQARATFWLAKEPGIKVFEEGDPYCVHGAKVFGRPITKKDDPEERTASKASLLAFGFLGGIGAGQTVAENYHIDFTVLANIVIPTATSFELLEGTRNYRYYIEKKPVKPLGEREGVAVDILKQRFRRDYPRIEEFGNELEYAFINGGVAGLITIEKDGDTRILTLPSGRQLFYRGVEIDRRGYSYSMRGRRHSLWKGQLIENCALGTEVCVINWYKKRAREIAPIHHQCYDEFTLMCDEDEVQETIARLTALTQTKPDFTAGLPLGFDIQHGRRYGK